MAMLARAQNLWRMSPLLSRTDSKHVDLESRPNTSNYFKDGIYRDMYQSLVKPDEFQDKLLDECWRWFCSHLDESIKRDWEKVLQGVIKGLGPTPPKEATEWPRQVSNVYKVLKVILDAISSRENVSIDDIMLELRTAKVLRTGKEDGLEGCTNNENEIKQMIWCLIGMVTMLYDANPHLHRSQLSLRQPASGLRSGARTRPGGILCGQQDITKSRDPLHALLTQFGEVLPRVQVDQEYLASVDLDYINIAYINFHTLKNVAKLEIEWVNTLNQHLQLDKRRRVLRVFRFPAFCRLLWTESEDSFMSQLFADHRNFQVNANLHTEHTFSDYLREVILSYRLLFGIDKFSRQAFRAELPAWRSGIPGNGATNTGSSCSTSSSVANPHGPAPTTPAAQPCPSDMDDPLLLLLCTTTTTESYNHTNHHGQFPPNSLSHLLWLLRGEEKSGLYDLEDFPFLGRRLAEIQRFSLKQKPNDWKLIFWLDRRDPQSFWNGWIACLLLVIGGGTIILQFWQLVFQIWGTFKPSH